MVALEPEARGVQAPAGERRRQLPLSGGVAGIVFLRALARLEQLDVAAGRVEGEATRAEVDRRREAHLERLQREQVEVDLGNVVAAVRPAQLPDIERVREVVEDRKAHV